jgi:hypothetical protein
VKATFIELPAFERLRGRYLSDLEFSALQAALMAQPEAGRLIAGCGGLRIIYFYWPAGRQFWLFTLYDKNQAADLTAAQRRILKQVIQAELSARRLNG